MPAQTLAIVNPESSHGATGRRWSRVESMLRDALGDLEVEHTRAPRDGERIAREAVRAGVDRLVVVGGDGTANEVVTGLLRAELGGRAQIGVLPFGSGGDLARKLNVPRDMKAAIERLRSGATRSLDAGRIVYRGRDGSEQCEYFVNEASFGISGLTVEFVRRVPRVLGGTFSYMIGALGSIARYRCAEVSLTVDGKLVHEGPLVLGVIANGCYFGGGMRIAPNAEADDGLFDVVVIRELSKPRLIANFPSLYRGTHLQHPAVSVFRGQRVEANAAVGEVWLDVDGDPPGTLPASIELLPGAITLFGAAD